MISAQNPSLSANLTSSALNFIKRIFLFCLFNIAKAPLAFLIISFMTITIFIAALNALFWQNNPHPAPLFSVSGKSNLSLAINSPDTEQIVVQEINKTNNNNDNIKTQPIPPIPVNSIKKEKIEHEDVKKLQKKLMQLGFFKDKIDGYYGPNTANAIRNFESFMGLKPVGALTFEILQMIESVPLSENSNINGGNNSISNNIETPSNIEIKPAEQIQSLPQNESEKRQSEIIDPLMEITKKVANSSNIGSNVEKYNFDKELVKKVQLGLASLGFLQGKIDGIFGPETAKAIRNFEVYYNYEVSGVVSEELIDLLKQAGAKLEI